MKKVNNFVAKHNHNSASVYKDRSKEIPRNDKFQEDWLQEMSDIDQELGLYRTIDFREECEIIENDGCLQDSVNLHKLLSIMDDIILNNNVSFKDFDVKSSYCENDNYEFLVYKVDNTSVETVVDMNFELCERVVEEGIDNYRLIGRFDYEG